MKFWKVKKLILACWCILITSHVGNIFVCILFSFFLFVFTIILKLMDRYFIFKIFCKSQNAVARHEKVAEQLIDQGV